MSDLVQVERLLCTLGIERANPARLAALIRFVQRVEGHRECFGEGAGCPRADCAWRSRCPGWAATHSTGVEGVRPLGPVPG